MWTFCDRLRRVSILDGRSPSEAVSDVNKMGEHLVTCLEMQGLTPFPKVFNQ